MRIIYKIRKIVHQGLCACRVEVFKDDKKRLNLIDLVFECKCRFKNIMPLQYK